MRERKLLDEVDIVSQRLNSKIDQLSAELTVLTERHSTVHDHLQHAREELKNYKDIQGKLERMQRDYNQVVNALTAIAGGTVEKPVEYARQKLKDL